MQKTEYWKTKPKCFTYLVSTWSQYSTALSVAATDRLTFFARPMMVKIYWGITSGMRRRLWKQ